MPDNGTQLAAFQSMMLEALHEHDDAAEILATLKADPASEPFLDYLDELEPRMVEVAAELLKKWGRRSA